MKRLRDFVLAFNVIVTYLFTLMLREVEGRLPSPGAKLGLYGAGLVALLLLIKVASVLATSLTNLRPLHSVLLGDEDIEGVWLDFSRNAGGTWKAVSITYIDYRNGSFRLSGKTYAADDSPPITWRAVFTHFENFILSYRYASATDLPATPKIDGYGEFTFAQLSGPPDAYEGYYFTHEPAVYTLRGKRIRDRAILEQLKTEEGRVHYAREAMDLEYAGSGPTALPRTGV